MKNDGLLLEDTLKQLNRKFGNVRIKRLNELPAVKDNVVSTGIIGLDVALGVGGVKKGSIVEIHAPESAGKTALALHLCRQFQKSGKPVLYIDSERTLTRETIESIGVMPDSFYLMYADNLEMALEVCKMAAGMGIFSAIVIDSLTGLVPKAQMDGDVGDSYVGLFPRIMSETLPTLVPLLDDSGCALIVINQIREKPGVMFGCPENATGGRALKYYASLRLDIRKVEIIKCMGVAVGFRTRVKVVKNKIAAPLKEAQFDLMFGQGISVEGDALDQAVEKGIITKRSSWYLYNGDKIGRDRESAKQYLKGHPVELEEITGKLRELCFAV